MNSHRIISLDGLRGAAALAVAIPHFFMAVMPGSQIAEMVAILGVEVFFLLSGFVLAPQILYCLEGNSSARFRVFVLRRWMRTLPPYILALFVSAIMVHSLFEIQFFKYLFFVQNIATIDVAKDFFAIAWSLSVEEWFYIVFPLFMIVLRGLGFRVSGALTLFFAIALVMRLAGAAVDDHWAELSRRLVLYRLDTIAFGFGLYLFVNGASKGRRAIAFRIAGPLAIVSLAALVGLFESISQGRSIPAQLTYLYAAPLFAGCVLLTFYSMEWRFSRSKILSFLSSFFGDISYGVYLLHLAVIIVIQQTLGGFSLAIQLACFLIGVVASSYLMRTLFEQPILAMRPSYRSIEAPRPGMVSRTREIVARWSSSMTARKAGAYALAMVALGVATEGFSLVLVKALARYHPEFIALDLDSIPSRITQETIQGYVGSLYHPQLGWIYRPNRSVRLRNSAGTPFLYNTDENGSRINPFTDGPKGIITIYGDSYGGSEEVNDDESWQYYLSLLAGLSIESFSTGAYGTDQVVLRLERDLAAGRRSKIIILDIQGENIRNIMSAYRMFYNPNDGHKIGFKPILSDASGSWSWVMPRLARPEDRSSLAEAFAWAKRWDLFYQINATRPRDSSPYILQAARALVYLIRMNGMGQDYLRLNVDRRVFWRYEPAQRRMAAIVDRFMALSRTYGFRPVLAFLPEGGEVFDFYSRQIKPTYSEFADDIRKRYAATGLIVVDALRRPMYPNSFNVTPFAAHPSAYGNRVIASALFEALAEATPSLLRRSEDESRPSTEVGVDPGLARFAPRDDQTRGQ
jgi:peptidoglycan/LPS O-acetylase OafA/YrhL